MEELELAEGVASQNAEEWNGLVGDESPFLQWEWLAALEQTGAVGDRTGWHARPLVARERGRLVAACPLYFKGHSEGEFVFDWSWADAAQRAGINYYPKMLVAVPFTPVSGARLLVAPGEDRARWHALLAEALRATCQGNDISGVHVNFCREDELDALESAGYQVRVGLQYHWRNHGYETFEDYLGQLRSKRRNQIRRERRELEKQEVTVQQLTGDEIPDALFGPMYEFYLATIRSRYWGRQYLNRELFEVLKGTFRKHLVFIVAFQGGEPIAGTFNVRKGDTLYGRYWGATRELRHLHFNVCYYAAIEYCILNGLQHFEPGAGGEHKQVRGFDAEPTLSAHFVSDPRLGSAIGRFLEAERGEIEEAIGWYRERSALKSGR
jgi:predicted N-acyltransferase